MNLINIENIVLTEINKGKSLKLEFSNISDMNYYLCREELEELKVVLESYLEKWGKNFIPEDRPYTEEITYYKDSVERSLMIYNGSGYDCLMRLNLTCYTDVKGDANWMELSPSRVKKFVGLIHGYLYNKK